MSGFGPRIRASLFCAVVIALSAMLLTGCANATAERVGDEVRKELRLHEAEDGSSVVDFDQLVPGDWSQLILACNDVDNADMDAALGFNWVDGPNMDAKNYAYLFVFSNGTQVEVSYAPEVDDSAEERYFWPCPPPSEGSWVGGPVVVDRANSKIRFHFDAAEGEYPPIWYVPRDELERLTELG